MPKKIFLYGGVIALTIGFIPAQASAQEVRFGAMAHDVEVFGLGGKRKKENSASVTAEYIWETPSWMGWSRGARPYVYASGNLAGLTSHAGAGVNYRKYFKQKYYAEWGFGLSAHTGKIRVANPIDTYTDFPDATNAELSAEIARRFQEKAEHIEFGSRALFRNQFVIGYQFNETYSGEIVYEHLSNGRVIGGPENEGLDNVGLRVARKF